MTSFDSDSIVEAFRHEGIILVFGAGISTSLAGKDMGWKSWLRHAIQFLDNSEGLSERLDSASSVEELTAVAEDLMNRCKQEGVYDSWMTSFICDPVPTNCEAIDAIHLMSETGCHFLTTNYDTLLEKATGRNSLSYVNKSSTYAELESYRSDSVIHIHGYYADGNDDIIATQDDYKRIIQDLGAQFIQNIASTRILVFVGCGGTMDDENIGRMVAFSHDELHLDALYFYLFCGDSHPELPGYVMPVRYGDGYEDLPSFLRSLAEIRLRSIAETHPIVRLCASSLNGGPGKDYTFYGSNIGFFGRFREMAILEMFLGDTAEFRWTAITGQAGMGKSRLAYEAMLKFRNRCFPFFIDTDADAELVSSFEPMVDALVFYDYVLGSEGKIARSVTALYRKFRGTGHKLRVVFLERADTTLPGSWHWNLTQAMSQAERSDFRRCEYVLHPNGSGKGGARFMRLDDLDPDSVSELVGGVIETMGLDPNRAICDALRDEYASKSERNAFRPLFVRIYVESRVHNGLTARCTFTDDDELLKERIIREQGKWESGLNGDNALLRSLIRLILRASISGRLDLKRLPEMYSSDWYDLKRFLDTKTVSGEERTSLRMCFQSEWGQSVELQNDSLVSNYPDIIKERMFSYYLDGDDSWEEICDEVWENDREQFVTFIRRCIGDFPDSVFFRTVVMRYGTDTDDVNSLRMRLACIENLTSSMYLVTLEDFEMLETEFEFWRKVRWANADTSKINRIHIEALALVADAYWNLAQSEEMCRCLYHLTKIPSGHDEELQIAFERIAYQADVGCLFEVGKQLIDMERRLKSKVSDWYVKRSMDIQILRHVCIRCHVKGNSAGFRRYLENLKNEIDESDEDETELVMASYYYAELVSQKRGGSSIFSEMNKWSNDKELSDMSFFYLYSVMVLSLIEKVVESYSSQQSEIIGKAIRNAVRKGIMEHIDELQETGPYSSAAKIDLLSLVLRAEPDDAEAETCRSMADCIVARYPYSDEVLAAYISMLKDYHVLYRDERIPTSTVEFALSLALRCPESPYVQRQYCILVRESVERGNPVYEENKVLIIARMRNNMMHVELETTEEGSDLVDKLITLSFGGPFNPFTSMDGVNNQWDD